MVINVSNYTIFFLIRNSITKIMIQIYSVTLKILRDRLQMWLLILRKFTNIYANLRKFSLFPLKSLICLNSLNIKSEIWRRALKDVYDTMRQNERYFPKK